MNHYETQTDFELTQIMKKLEKQITGLRSTCKPLPNATPEQVIAAAKASNEVESMVDQQLDISRELLRRDDERQKQKAVRLEKLEADGKKEVDALLRELPAHAADLVVALNYLGAEWQRLLEISQGLRQKNLVLLHEGKPQITSASLKLEPSHLQTILKRSLYHAFGSGTIDAHLATPVPQVSLTDEVDEIVQRYSGD